MPKMAKCVLPDLNVEADHVYSRRYKVAERALMESSSESPLESLGTLCSRRYKHICQSGECLRGHDARCAPTIHSHLSLIATVPVISTRLPSLASQSTASLHLAFAAILVAICSSYPRVSIRGWFHSFAVNFAAFRRHAWPS
jgi:hypothetical protein